MSRDNLPSKKTKIVCTIGPASQSSTVLEQLIDAGMNVVRINFAHGDLAGHREVINRVRVAAADRGRVVAIMGDLPGPKLRIGTIESEPVVLERGNPFVLRTTDVTGDAGQASHSFPQLPEVVKSGDSIFLNDGYIQLQVDHVDAGDVHCRVIIGGQLSSNKGINLPGIDLGIAAFTDRDRELLAFAAEQNLDAVSQSFVQSAADIQQVRDAAAELGYTPFVIAKIERASALDRMDEIIAASDGIMVARGDLGVEIPIEEVARAQKRLIATANRTGKPIITATHMLESMISSSRPTRAEATDVANAILDGTDCVMLSGETAVGDHPVLAVQTMARIAAVTETDNDDLFLARRLHEEREQGTLSLDDLVSLNTFHSTRTLQPALIFAPTRSGSTPRLITRFRLPIWIVAFCTTSEVCAHLQFSYGIYPVQVAEPHTSWLDYVCGWSSGYQLAGNTALLVEGTGTLSTSGTMRIDVVELP
jgi:pyruvate kinase